MKISELISMLSAELSEIGDVEACVDDDGVLFSVLKIERSPSPGLLYMNHENPVDHKSRFVVISR